ncbi:MAG: hypothetical protein Q7S11_02910 [bacterium]|nr:hypothetical protein [bacterium]
MNGIISLLLLSASVGLILTFLGVILLVILWLLAHAKIFFMFPQEGQGYVVMKGGAYKENKRGQIITEGGEFHKFIIALKGRHLEWDTKLNTWGIVDGDSEHKGFLGLIEKSLGMYYIGIWPIYKVYRYEFRWDEWDPAKKDPELIPRDEPTDFFYVSTAEYAVLAKEAETGTTLKIQGNPLLGGNVRVNVQFSLFVRVVYPQIALFENVDWFIQLQKYSLSRTKDYVGVRDFNDLRAETSPEGIADKGTFSDAIVQLNTEVKGKKDKDGKPEGVLRLLGVEIVSAQMLTVDLVDEKGDVQAAVTAIYVEYQKAEAYAVAIKKRAEADADAIDKRYTAIEKFPYGPQIRRLEAMEKAGEKGNVVIFDSAGDGKSSVDQQTRLLSAILTSVKGKDAEKDTQGDQDTTKPEGGAP